MELTSETIDYRGQLRSELLRRKMHNTSYSLRSFAKAIGVSVAFLSKILKGEKDLSVNTALLVAERLGYSPTETAQFCQAVQLSKADTPKLKAALTSNPSSDSERDSEYLPIDLDVFQIISDWYHYAILELSVCRSGRRSEKFDGKYVAIRLGISEELAKTAIGRLIRIGLLELKNGRWVKSKKFLTTSSSQPSRAIRNFHLQMIEKAKTSVESQSTELRDISGITVPISLDKIEIARREIQTFRRRMAKLLDSSHPTEVYQLNLQFFALSHSTQSASKKLPGERS